MFDRRESKLIQEVKNHSGKAKKLQLNSGNVSDELYAFYHDIGMRTNRPTSAGVAEALEYAKNYMAQKYELDKCHNCRASIEPDDIFCRKCGSKIR